MTFQNKTFSSIDHLRDHIKTGIPTFYFASKTSTVIDFSTISEYIERESFLNEFTFGDLSCLPKELKVLENGSLRVKGPVCWQEAKEFCQLNNREILTSPTEELASVLSGISTSATGEQSFGHGNLRNQVLEISYLESCGDIRTLNRNNLFHEVNPGMNLAEQKTYNAYQRDFVKYDKFKNAPFPRLKYSTDLMIGTEGQLGVIIDAVIKTQEAMSTTSFIIKLPRWEEDYRAHLEIFETIQPFRGKISVCEMLDYHSLMFLDAKDRPFENADLIYIEFYSQYFDFICDNFLGQLKSIKAEEVFEINKSKWLNLRMGVPRAIEEKKTRSGIQKKGTDIQTSAPYFPHLLEMYRDLAKRGIDYVLFGHFGDAHLHFNFLPKINQVKETELLLQKLYQEVDIHQVSPFAEHGIGILKQKFIKRFWGTHQYEIFSFLKKTMDPENKFFPNGYMNLRA